MPSEDDAFYVGNVARDRQASRNWFIGSFIPPGDPRHSEDVEVKWSVHAEPFEQQLYKYNKIATTVCIVIAGSATFKFFVNEKEPEKILHAGDYVIWKPLIPHKLIVPSAAEMIAVRWPSNDTQVELDH